MSLQFLLRFMKSDWFFPARPNRITNSIHQHTPLLGPASRGEKEAIQVTDRHRSLHADLCLADKARVAGLISDDFPSDRVSVVMIASLSEAQRCELEARIAQRRASVRRARALRRRRVLVAAESRKGKPRPPVRPASLGEK